jgi:hypothetical protein
MTFARNFTDNLNACGQLRLFYILAALVDRRFLLMLTTKEQLLFMMWSHKKHSHYGFWFVPLVMICGLDILFLRPDKPGGVIWAGDIDNRLKTLLPEANERYHERTPEPDETPFYCLLEDDKLITKVSIETDQLLQFVTQKEEMSEVRLIITVRLRPYEINIGNVQFG